MKTEQIHIDLLKAGDTILHDGKEMTVCNKDLKRGGFMGTSVFGDSYKSGYQPVIRVLKSWKEQQRASRG